MGELRDDIIDKLLLSKLVEPKTISELQVASNGLHEHTVRKAVKRLERRQRIVKCGTQPGSNPRRGHTLYVQAGHESNSVPLALEQAFDNNGSRQ